MAPEAVAGEAPRSIRESGRSPTCRSYVPWRRCSVVPNAEDGRWARKP